ncbi:MAG: hypothetical protein ACK53Y_18545, partial [bacterium]
SRNSPISLCRQLSPAGYTYKLSLSQTSPVRMAKHFYQKSFGASHRNTELVNYYGLSKHIRLQQTGKYGHCFSTTSIGRIAFIIL